MTTPADDQRWLVDPLTRISLRYGRALHELSRIPGLIALAQLWDLPEATDVQDTAAAAIDELERVIQYAQAITDPGEATCQMCGANLGHFHGMEGWQHWRLSDDPADPPRVLWTPDHEPVPVWSAPARPDWRNDDTDLTPDAPTDDAQSSEDPGGTRHQASPPGSLRKEHHP